MGKYAVKKIGIIERYQEYLPVTDKTPIISLNEGNTPLILAEALPLELGLKNVRIYYKFEGLNPTGSFKDRGMTMAISKAMEAGSKAVMCASTGNTSASAAAYACRCGLKCYVLIPEGKIAKGKLLQAYRYGAKVIMIEGNFDKALELVKEITAEGHITLVNSINPYRIEGQKTAAFEIVDDLGDAPEYHALPVGNAGNITAYWKGYKEYKKSGEVRDFAADARIPGGGFGADRARASRRKTRDACDRDPNRQSRELAGGCHCTRRIGWFDRQRDG